MKTASIISPVNSARTSSNTGNLRGANVYVDNELVGQAPCKSGALVSGSHVVRIAKEMYEPYSESVEVSDNETTRFAPNLRADYAEVTLKVDADAEIWVNDQKKGVRSWKGALANGTYKIECKQKGHESSLTTKEITTDMQGQTITLESPRPIYGSLSVESTPFATIYIDGKSVGDTPRFISEILVGNHELRLVKSGYVDHVETISVGKGERKDVKVDLAVVKQPEKPAAPQSDPPSTKPGKVEASNTSIVPDIIEGIGPNASCEELNRVLSAKMAANPNDATLLKRILITLDYRGCTDSRLFIEAVINLYSLDPCPEASYGLGVKALNERKYTDASKFFDQATRNGGNYIKYRAFCNLAICSQQVGNFSRARDLAKQAAQVNPTAGEPYLIMAQLYAESTKQFNGEIESKAVYWAAVDKCNQAKSIDASAAERANSMIRIYSAAFPTMETIFFNDYSEGQRYHVGGWIDENTTIRARK